MSDEHQGLYRAVLEHPTDDAYRLIFADFLEEKKLFEAAKLARNAVLFTLCRWGCLFNIWQWPIDYPHPKPEGFDSLHEGEKKSFIRTPHGSVKAIVGTKNRLRYCNQIHSYRMTDERFEAFWAETYERKTA